MLPNEFKVGDRIRNMHPLLTPDYPEGEVVKIGRKYLHVKWDKNTRLKEISKERATALFFKVEEEETNAKNIQD